MAQEIFEIKITEEGKRYIKKLYVRTKIVLLLTIIGSIISIIRVLPTLKYFPFMLGRSNHERLAVLTIFDLTYHLFFIILMPLQGYFYFQFSKMANRSVVSTSSEQYNKAFSFLVKGIFMFILCLLANIIYGLVLLNMKQ